MKGNQENKTRICIINYKNRKNRFQRKISNKELMKISDLNYLRLNRNQLKIQQKFNYQKTYKKQLIKFEDQKQGFQQELERVQKLCEEFSSEIKDSEKRLLCLNDENEQYKQLLDQKEEDRRYLEMMIQEERDNTNKISAKFQDEKRFCKLQQKIKGREHKIQKNYQNKLMQGKLDQEKQGLIRELQETLQKSKQKTKQMQAQIQFLKQKLQEKSKEDIIVNKQIQDLQGEQIKLQSLLEDSKYKTDQALNEASFQVQEVKEMKGELEKYRSTLQIEDEKLSKYDVQYQIDQKEKQRLIHEIEISKNRVIQMKFYYQRFLMSSILVMRKINTIKKKCNKEKIIFVILYGLNKLQVQIEDRRV